MREPFSDWTNWRAERASPPSGSPPDGCAKSAKIDISYRGRAQNIFSIKELIFAGFASLLTQGRPLPTPTAPLVRSRRAKIYFPQTPFSFYPLAGQHGFFRRAAGHQFGRWMGLDLIFKNFLANKRYFLSCSHFTILTAFLKGKRWTVKFSFAFCIFRCRLLSIIFSK